jgi:hypothetical protein
MGTLVYPEAIKWIREESKKSRDQNVRRLSQTIISGAHRRLCPFGVEIVAIERKLRVIHPRWKHEKGEREYLPCDIRT